MKELFYHLKYQFLLAAKCYTKQAKGDTSTFRYPHLKFYFKNFDSDLKNDIFLLKRNENDVLEIFGRESLEILTNISDEAYFEYVFNLLGVHVRTTEAQESYKGVCKKYHSRSFKKMLKSDYYKVNFNKIKINEDYQEIKNYLKHSLNYETYVYPINYKKYRNIAYSMHGLNILFIDQNDYNYGVGLIDAIINNENGIKGKKLQNLSIEESYGKACHMALERYIQNDTYMDPDLFFMKGYLALAFQDKMTPYNLLYALIEPFMKLLFSTINMHALMEYVFEDNEEEMKTSFEKAYPTFYNKIYGEKRIFKRINILKDLALRYDLDITNLYKILFNKEHLVNTNIDYHVIAFIYLSKKVNHNKELLFDLIISCYPWSIENKTEITLENWSKHVLLKYGEKTHRMLLSEYEKVKNIIEKL